MGHFFEKSRKAFNTIVDILGFAAMAVIVVSCFAQVIYRYFFGKSIFWAEETSIYLMIWIAFLGAAKATANQENTRLGFVVKALPKKLGITVEVLAHLCMIGFSTIITIYGFALASTQWVRTSVSTVLPMALVYGALPVCSIFMVLFTVFALIECIYKGSNKGKGADGKEVTP